MQTWFISLFPHRKYQIFFFIIFIWICRKMAGSNDVTGKPQTSRLIRLKTTHYIFLDVHWIPLTKVHGGPKRPDLYSAIHIKNPWLYICSAIFLQTHMEIIIQYKNLFDIFDVEMGMLSRFAYWCAVVNFCIGFWITQRAPRWI